MKRLMLVATLPLLVYLAACTRDPKEIARKYVETGNKYYEKGKYKEASIMYRRALQKNMRDAQAHYRLGLVELKQGMRGGATQRPAGTRASHHQTPPGRLGLHLLEAGETAPPKEAVPEIGDGTLHPGFVLRMGDPGGIDEASVVNGQFPVAAVKTRVIEIGTQHPAGQVVADQTTGHSPEEGKGGEMRLYEGRDRHA